MESIKKIIITRLRWLVLLMVVLILPLVSFLQVRMLRSQARENAHVIFQQIQHILEENTRELETITANYRETCLLNAQAIAYMIQNNPDILGDIEQFRMIAGLMEVDEIHIFDKTGRIFTGTHPEYYNYTFETGEQIGFFAPLLQDKSLRLCQDVTPNTAEGKLVQYSALWSSGGEFIVQVGMYPSTILEYTQKNELSYIFSLLQGSVGVNLYAIDSQTGTIMGSTSSYDNGKDMADIGLDMSLLSAYMSGTPATVNGVNSYCIFTEIHNTLIGYVIAEDALYDNAPTYTLLMVACMGLIAAAIVTLMWQFTRKYIISSIDQVNTSLTAVTDGNLDKRVDVQSSLEFSELSNHINEMIRSILSSTDKMSYILNQTNMRIGVYEYSTKMKTVRFTEHIPDLFGWSARTGIELCSDYRNLQKYLENVIQNPVPGEENTFQLQGRQERYIKLEEVCHGPDTLGIVIDVTEDILTRRRIEQERDIDLMTSLYNRRAMERNLEMIFQQDMGFGALILVDADRLKIINDRYGHTVGDWYIKRIADALARIGTREHIAARLGGDEFILLLYGYESEAAVREDLTRLIYAQEHTRLSLKDGTSISVDFSFGYVMTEGRTDYTAMMAEADEQMYEAKRIRKQAAQEQN